MRFRGRRAIGSLVRAMVVFISVGPGSHIASAQSLPPADIESPAPSRPRLLIPSYIAFASLQALDVDSTRRVLAAGGFEANPVVRALGGTPGTIALKAGTTAALIVAAEHLRKQHPTGAAVLVLSLNAAMVAIVAHNYAIVRR